MAETGQGGNNITAGDKAVLSSVSEVKAMLARQHRHAEDFKRTFNNAKRTEDQKMNSAAFAATKSADKIAVSDDVAESLKRQLFEAIHSAAYDAKARAKDEKEKEGGVSKTKVGAIATGAALAGAGVAAAGQQAVRRTATQQKLDAMFGNGDSAKKDNKSAQKLDELFGKVNTKLDGIDTSINDVKKDVKGPIMSKVKEKLADVLIAFVTSAPGMMFFAFVGGFIWGWLNNQPWFNFLKKVISSPIVKAIFGGVAIAFILNKLTGGLLGAFAKPLLGLLGKGIGALITKGLPLLLKGGLALAKGMMGLLCNPVGAVIAVAVGSVLAGLAIGNWIQGKLQKKREEETKKINADAEKFKSADENKKKNQAELDKLKGMGGDVKGGSDQFMQVKGKNGWETVKGHFDADGNFVVVQKMNSEGKMEDVEPDSYGIQNVDVKKNTKKISFNWIAQTEKGLTRVEFNQVEMSVGRAFMDYIDKNYCETGELPAGTKTKLWSSLKILAAHYSVEGEGLAMDDGEKGLIKKLDDTWVTLCQVAKQYGLKQDFEKADDKSVGVVYTHIVNGMVPKSCRDVVIGAVTSGKFNFKKPIGGFWSGKRYHNTIAFAATIYQIWLDIFLNFVNSEFGTDLKSNTISKAEYDSAMEKEDGVQSQALATSVSIASDIRMANAKNGENGNKVVATGADPKAKGAKKDAASNIAEFNDKRDKAEFTAGDGSSTKNGVNSVSGPAGKTADQRDLAGMKDSLDKLAAKVDESSKNSKAAADNSKNAENAGVAAAATSAKGVKKPNPRFTHSSGRKVKSSRGRR